MIFVQSFCSMHGLSSPVVSLYRLISASFINKRNLNVVLLVFVIR